MTWQVPFLLIGLLVLAPIVWRRPAVGLYVLVGAAVTLEQFPLGFPDSLTDTIGFFLNLNNTAGLPVSFSPAEVLMAVALAGWLAASRGADPRESRPGSGPLRRAYLAFLVVVALAEAYGLLSGGSLNISLWEMRPQVYGFVVFLLASSLIRERRQLVVLVAVFLGGAALKTGIGYIRYFVDMHGDLNGAESVLGHEDSYFLVLFLVAAVAAAIWVRRRAVVIPLLLASPLVATVMLENRRRIAMLALWGALVVVVALAIRFEPNVVRLRVVVCSVLFAAAFAAYVSINWNAEDGLAAQVVRPVHTITGEVDQRDLMSDLYRINENADIKATYALNPLMGTGFGLPMLVPFPLADISQQYPLWQFIPHNSLLWIGMRMGVVGMAAFWALIGTTILVGVRAVRVEENEDRLLRAAAAFALAAVIAELIVGYGDLQLESYRNMIFFGLVLGVIDALPRVRAVPVARPRVLPHVQVTPAARMHPERRAS